jgi:hypothetical protein
MLHVKRGNAQKAFRVGWVKRARPTGSSIGMGRVMLDPSGNALIMREAQRKIMLFSGNLRKNFTQA